MQNNTPGTIDSSKPSLWNHQKLALEKALNRFALFFDPGCGKSRTALELLNRYQEPGSASVLIFAPLNVCRNWQNEISMFSSYIKNVFVVAGGTKGKKLKTLEKYRSTTGPRALIMNIESLRSKEYQALIPHHNFIIVDESHNFKSATSLQTKGLIALIERFNPRYLYMLTGTPAPQGEIDLWSTFYLLGVTKLNFFSWRKKWFDDKNIRRAGTPGYYPDFVIRQSSKLEFQKLLSGVSITANKNDVLDLPELLHLSVYCDLSPEQRRHYETMYKFLFAIDEDGHELNASNILSRTLRLQQITAGFIGEAPVKENSRLAALDYAIEQTADEQFIIWTIFKATYNQLGKHLADQGISHGFLTGEQSAEERFKIMEMFQKGELRALIAHPRAGGVGVNLTAASYSIHYTKNFNLVDDMQCEARNYRGGSERHSRITRIDIIAADTLDEQITAALRNKKSVQDFILGLKKEYNYGKSERATGNDNRTKPVVHEDSSSF